MSMNFVNEPTRAWDPKNRLREMINEGSDAANVDKLVELLIMDGFDFSLTADAMTPIDEAERVVSVGMGIAVKSEMYLIENLAQAAGAATGMFKTRLRKTESTP
ncbi:MAG: hypothetical protein ACLR1V_03060 [Coprococcus sp.]